MDKYVNSTRVPVTHPQLIDGKLSRAVCINAPMACRGTTAVKGICYTSNQSVLRHAERTTNQYVTVACESRLVVIHYRIASTWIKVDIDVCWASEYAGDRREKLREGHYVDQVFVRNRAKTVAIASEVYRKRAGKTGWNSYCDSEGVSARCEVNAAATACKVAITGDTCIGFPADVGSADLLNTRVTITAATTVARNAGHEGDACREGELILVNPLSTHAGGNDVECESIVHPRSVICLWAGDRRRDKSLGGGHCAHKQHPSEEEFKRGNNSSFHEKDYDLSFILKSKE